MSEKKHDTSEELAVLILTLVLLPFAFWWWGFVLAKLWLWFLAQPLDLPTLNPWHAIGIALLVKLAMFRTESPDTEKSPLERFGLWFLNVAIYPAVILGFGALAKAFAF